MDFSLKTGDGSLSSFVRTGNRPLSCVLCVPILTFVESLLIGINGYWGKLSWFSVPVMGLGLILTEFFTFEAANHITFGNTNYPDPYLLLVGAAISALGLGVGKGISVLNRRKKEK